MLTLNTRLILGLWVAGLAGGMTAACQGPEEFYRNGTPGLGGGSPGTGGTTGTGGLHATGGTTGTGGVFATGGVIGTGGTRATGGTTGTGGVTATGGVTGTGGTRATGGVTGTGGISNTGGTIGAGGGAAGSRGTGGVTATGGVTGGAGSTGTAGATGTGPCAGLCTNPVPVAPNANSGGLGTGATCNEVIGSVAHLVCGNFVAPRTFTVNAKSLDCTTGGAFTLPAPVNGGFCMQATAGNYSYAYFTTY